MLDDSLFGLVIFFEIVFGEVKKGLTQGNKKAQLKSCALIYFKIQIL